jgi:hypothetical protein
MKRILMVLSFALLISALMALNGFAAPQRYSCNGGNSTTTFATVANNGQAQKLEKEFGDVCQPFEQPTTTTV